MSRRNLHFVLLGITVVLACLSLDWATGPFFPPISMMGSEADFIEGNYPHHLINPAWLGSLPGLWGMAEAFARLAVVALGTLGLFLLCRVGMAESTTTLRGNLMVYLLPPAAAPVFWGLLQIFGHWGDPAHAFWVRLALLTGSFLFILMVVVQFITLQFARWEHQRLMLAYCCGLLIFASSYAGVTYLGRIAVPILPPNVVYASGAADAAWSAFMIIGWPGLLLLAPMAAASWPLLRHQKSQNKFPLTP